MWSSNGPQTITHNKLLLEEKEESEDTKEVIRIRKAKDRQCNGQTKNDKQRSTKHNTEN